MAKRRMLSRRISHSKKVNKLSLKAQLIYTWIIPYLDDYGCYIADPEDIKSEIFPKNKRISVSDIESALSELQVGDLIIIYAADGKFYQKYNSFNSFQTFQSDRPKKHEYPECKAGLEANGIQWNPVESLSKDKLSKDKLSKEKEKERFLTFVLLTKDEHQKLIQRYGPKPAQSLIDDLDYYISNNKKGRDPYTDHYRTLCKWAKKDNIPELHKAEKDESAALEKKRQEMRAEHGKFIREADEKKLITVWKSQINLRWLINELRPEIAGKAKI
jgi:hypothetical protein